MRDINYYLDKAKTVQGFKSDLQLNRELGFKGSMISFVRTGKSHLSDEKMIKLANLAKLDAEAALIDLNIWRTPPEAQKAYASILQKLEKATLSIAFISLFLASFSPFPAVAKVSNEVRDTIYYGKYMGIWKRVLSLFFNKFDMNYKAMS